jgi:phage gp46-like protein
MFRAEAAAISTNALAWIFNSAVAAGCEVIGYAVGGGLVCVEVNGEGEMEGQRA